MGKKAAVQPALKRGSRHLFEKECATRLQNTPDLSNASLPTRYMVQHAKVKDGIEACVRKRQLVHTRCREFETAVVLASEVSSGAVDLFWIEVDATDMRGMELIQQKRETLTSPAAHLQYAVAFHGASELTQEWYLIEALHESTCRIVDQ